MDGTCDAHKRKQFVDMVMSVTSKNALSDFYQQKYSALSIFNNDESEGVPSLTWEEIAQTSYLERLYTDDGHLAYLVKEYDVPSLIARTPADIAREPLQSKAKRPLVATARQSDTLLWSLWYYKHSILPLAGEENDALNAFAAARYGIDALVTDMATLHTFFPYLEKHNDIQQLQEVHVLGTSFDTAFLRERFPHAQLYLYITLPEVGVLAYTSLDASYTSTFTVAPTVLIEERGAVLLCTHAHMMPFPLIRYELPEEILFQEKVFDYAGYVTHFQYQ